jgi:lysophospholipase L1-like esterase
MPLGDSITLGVNGGYRVGLWQQLTALGYRVTFVGSQVDENARVPSKAHEGHPGLTIAGIAEHAQQWVASARPDVVLLMIGTNDLAWWYTSSIDAEASQLEALVAEINAAAPGAQIVVASIPPMAGTVAPDNRDRSALVRQYNAAIRQRVAMMAQRGKPVAFADVNAVLTLNDLYDGIHPTEAAHAKVAQVWFEALAPLLRP